MRFASPSSQKFVGGVVGGSRMGGGGLEGGAGWGMKSLLANAISSSSSQLLMTTSISDDCHTFGHNCKSIV